MVTKGQIFGRMSVGYQPVCASQPGLWPCFPEMPQYTLPHESALRGLGRPRIPLRPAFALAGLGRPNVIPQYGVSGLTFDGSGLFGTGIFGDGSWDWSEWLLLGIGAYALFSMFYTTKRTGRQATLKASSVLGRRRKSRAQKLRAKAKRLEEKRGLFEGLLFGSEA